MPRFARIVVPDFPYHVTHRGNRRGPVFPGASDRRDYLRCLHFYAKRHGLRIWAYCLMTNHVHLIAAASEVDSLAKAIGYAHRSHAQRVNRRKGWSGHLWANRFFSTPLDEFHLWAAARYVETNPVRAGIVERAETFRWSSAAAHAGLRRDPILAPDDPFPGGVSDWSEWLSIDLEPNVADRIRRNTCTGRVTGTEEFVRELERSSSRPLRPGRRGPKGSGRSLAARSAASDSGNRHR